jgi:hypothetical protein
MASADGRILALIPVGVGLLLAALLFRHDVVPNDVPLPDVDERRVAEVERSDDARAEKAAQAGLPGEVRALGETIRTFNATEARNPPDAHWAEIRSAVDEARRVALEKGTEAIVDLRAAQLAGFMREVAAWRKTHDESAELEAEGGGFIRRMTLEGWIRDGSLLVEGRELRVLFKLKWNAVTRMDQLPSFQPTFDELRVLYRFYLLHPHPSESAREQLNAKRHTTRSAADCETLAAGEEVEAEKWRLDKIDKLAELDPSYPAAYARGISLYRAAKYEASMQAFQDWLRAHPDGPLTLRARNYLHAAFVQAR